MIEITKRRFSRNAWRENRLRSIAKRPRGRRIAVWVLLGAALTVPLAFAATSPLLAWRQPVYIAAGIAGVLGLGLLLVQPLLAGGYLPGMDGARGRRVHRLVGGALVLAVVVHVGGLWITSPPDVIDALLFASPTPFSAWGVVAMWAVLAAALLAALRRRLRPVPWRRLHAVLALVTVGGTVVHALLIEGTMETISKAALCALVVTATIKTIAKRRIFVRRRRP